MSFAKRMKQAMKERSLTQIELSKISGIAKSSISQYLSGINIPKTEAQIKIADALGCSVDWLNSDEEEIQITKGSGITVAEAAKRLGKSTQFVRIALQKGVVSFGFAVKNKSKWSYYISERKLNEFIGA